MNNTILRRNTYLIVNLKDDAFLLNYLSYHVETFPEAFLLYLNSLYTVDDIDFLLDNLFKKCNLTFLLKQINHFLDLSKKIHTYKKLDSKKYQQTLVSLFF